MTSDIRDIRLLYYIEMPRQRRVTLSAVETGLKKRNTEALTTLGYKGKLKRMDQIMKHYSEIFQNEWEEDYENGLPR